MPDKLKIYLVAGFVLASCLLFGRSLKYDFVYDDLWRIADNPALLELSRPLRFFWDKKTQSSYPMLNTHTYRPLMTLGFALERRLWGDAPAGYRAVNIILHGVNAALVAVLSQFLFAFPIGGCVVAGLLFLVHPGQVESVVWIVERSNIMSTFFILIGMGSWIKFRNENKPIFEYVTYAALLLGLGFRENAAALPLIIPAIDLFLRKYSPRPLLWGRYAVLLIIAGAFVAWRFQVLGTVQQMNFWGGSFWANLIIVIKNVPQYLRLFFLPTDLTVSHLPLGPRLFDARLLAGLLFILLSAWGGFISFKGNRRVLFCLSLLLILWLPTSGLLPLAAQFAVRFIYPLLIPAGFLLGLFMNFLWQLPNSGHGRTLARIFLGCVFLALLMETQAAIPIWRNELSLWGNAVRMTPKNPFAWFCLGLEQRRQINEAESAIEKEFWAESAYASFRRSLSTPVMFDFAGEVFLKMAELDLYQNRPAQAKEHASRGLTLRPDLMDYWATIQRELKDNSGD